MVFFIFAVADTVCVSPALLADEEGGCETTQGETTLTVPERYGE